MPECIEQNPNSDIDEMNLNDISSEEELDPDEMRSKRSEGDLQLNQDECTPDLKATFEDQIDQMDQHLSGSCIHIYKSKIWSNN